MRLSDLGQSLHLPECRVDTNLAVWFRRSISRQWNGIIDKRHSKMLMVQGYGVMADSVDERMGTNLD